MFKKIIVLSEAVLYSAFLLGCGENSASEKIVQSGNSGIESVADIGDLPKCSEDNDGTQVFVKSESAVRICSSGDWYGIKGSRDTADFSCSTVELEDSSGVKILCNGDSVGVVLNGRNGAQGDRGEPGAQGATGVDCTVETLADNSGLKVLCGGDSVGVVYNGAKGETGGNFEYSDFTEEQLGSLKGDKGEQGDKGDEGKKGGEGDEGPGETGSICKLINIECIVHVACSQDTVSLDIQSDDESCKDYVIDEEAIATNLEGIGGSSQKGPFLTGSEVVANELQNGRTLAQTGKAFVGKILSDKGDFDIKTVSLASQYASLSAKGYYLNEVTGAPSKSQITLTALTNLRGRSIANINLLTHLENERAQYLVIFKKMTVASAKKKAENEVFNLFHIDSRKFSGYSEDLSIGGSSDGDAALLAMSILLQGDRTEAELSALLTTISKSMEETGKWEDDVTKIAIADWAASADSAGDLVKFHDNIASWGLSLVVPKFEPYIRHFWSKTLGLDDCTSDNVGVVAQPSVGKRSGTAKTRFTCVDSTDANVGLVWRVSTDYEKDTFGWRSEASETPEDGHIENGPITGKEYVYDAFGVLTEDGNAGWRRTSDFEMLYGACTKKLYGEVRSYRGDVDAGFYQCQEESHMWVKVLNTLTIDTQKWAPETDGFVKWGDSVGVIDKFTDEIPWTPVCYVYDESLSPAGFRVGESTDCSLGFGGCTKKVQALDEMRCTDGKDCFYCIDESWTKVTDDVAKNTRNLECSVEEGVYTDSIVPGTYDTWYYVCDAGTWRSATQKEYEICYTNKLCKLCLDRHQGNRDIVNEVTYVCEDGEWSKADETTTDETSSNQD